MRISHEDDDNTIMRHLRFIAATAYLAGFKQGRETPDDADTREVLERGFDCFWHTVVSEEPET